jgi:hypothetical protein
MTVLAKPNIVMNLKFRCTESIGKNNRDMMHFFQLTYA